MKRSTHEIQIRHMRTARRGDGEGHLVRAVPLPDIGQARGDFRQRLVPAGRLPAGIDGALRVLSGEAGASLARGDR